MTIVVPAREFTAESIFPNAPNAGARIKPFRQTLQRVNSWLGRQDSNLGMAESKTDHFLLCINVLSENTGEIDLH
jgi:hypothetical protein